VHIKIKAGRHRILAAILGAAILAVIGYYIGTVWRARVQTPMLVRAALESDRTELRASDLSAWQKCALLAIQDPDFYEHRGVKRPFWKAITDTTVTQAVVKHLYFESFKPGIRKIRQTLIALCALDPIVSKDDQLTLFLNLVWFYKSPEGEDIVGFADAARSYFNKSVAQLSEDQYLSLVAMLIGPTNYNPRTHPKENAERVEILKQIVIGRCRQ
jgi:membrane peptidoglycan carboxypeptidase